MRSLVAGLLLVLLVLPAVAVEPPFTVDFSANVTSGISPLVVQFTDLCTGSPLSCSWGIENNITSGCTGPLHTFTMPGSFDINLTATNGTAVLTETKHAYINVTGNGNLVSISFINRGIFGVNPVEITDKSTGLIATVVNTSTRNVRLADGIYWVQVEPGGLTDNLNSPDYGLMHAGEILRKNLVGVMIGGSIVFMLIGVFLWRKK